MIDTKFKSFRFRISRERFPLSVRVVLASRRRWLARDANFSQRSAAAVALSFKFTLFALLITAMGMGSGGARCAAQSSVSPNSADARVEQAEQLVADGVKALEQNDLTAALTLFKKALEINPRDVTAHTYLGVLADRAGDLAEAERNFATAAIDAPASSSARNNYGAILLKLGRLKQAATQFELSLRLDKNQPNALVNLAQIRFSSGTPEDMRAARELFERAYALAPDAEIARALIVLALRLKDREAAAKYFPAYSSRLDGANSPVNRAALRAELGGALLEAGLLKEAVVELSAAVGGDPSNTEAILRLAQAYLALKDIPSAGRTLESAVARGVDAAPIYVLLASVYEQSGHLENAIPAMRLAIERDPQSEAYRFTYGMLLTRALAPDAAVIRLKEALETFPRSARLWLALGIAHFKAGRNDEAAKSLSHSIELDPKYAPAHAYLGMTYVEIGQYDEAIKSYEQALIANEKLGVVNYLIADVLQKHAPADTVRLETNLARAVQLEPTFAPARMALGKLYLRTDRLLEATAELERVIKLDPNLAEAYYQLGRVYMKLKRTAEAQATLAMFKRLSDTQKEQAQKDRREIVQRLADVRF